MAWCQGSKCLSATDSGDDTAFLPCLCGVLLLAASTNEHTTGMLWIYIREVVGLFICSPLSVFKAAETLNLCRLRRASRGGDNVWYSELHTVVLSLTWKQTYIFRLKTPYLFRLFLFSPIPIFPIVPYDIFFMYLIPFNLIPFQPKGPFFIEISFDHPERCPGWPGLQSLVEQLLLYLCSLLMCIPFWMTLCLCYDWYLTREGEGEHTQDGA